MKALPSFLIAAFMMLSLNIAAQHPWTRPITTPQEHTINDLIRIPGTNKIIAVGEGSTVMKSDNYGETWEILLNPAGMNNQFACKCVFFIDEMTGFIGGGKAKILKTVDGGLNWELKFGADLQAYPLCINDIYFTDDSTGFATGCSGLLFRTTDTGETWLQEEYNSTLKLTDIVMVDNQIGYILCNNYYEKYANRWLKTTDGGETWILEEIPELIPDGEFNSLHYINDSTGFMHMMTSEWNGTVFKTTDVGLTWHPVANEWGGYDCHFEFYDEQHGVALLNTWMYSTMIMVTEDGGNSWTEKVPPGMGPSVNAIHYFSQSQIMTAGANGEIFVSNDAGYNWEEMSSREFNNHIYQVQFTDNNTGFALAEEFGGGVAESSLFKTSDGGLSWNRTSIPYFYKGAIHFLSNDDGFFISQDNSFNYTTDGGETWLDENIYTGYDFDVRDIQFFDINHGIIAGDKVIRTSDGGLTWQYATPAGTGDYYDIEYLSENIVFIAGSNNNGNTALYKSTDGGLSWTSDNIGDFGYAKDLLFIGSDTAFLVCNNTILKSFDGFITWDTAVINNTGYYSLNAVYFVQNIGYAIGDGEFNNLFKSKDGGNTWNPVNSYTTSALNGIYFSNSLNGMIFGDHGVVMQTTTGGVVSIEKPDLQVNTTFTAFPNPAMDVVNISFHTSRLSFPAKLEIYNASGSQQAEYLITNFSNFEIRSKGLKPGIYLLRMTDRAGHVETIKIIKL